MGGGGGWLVGAAEGGVAEDDSVGPGCGTAASRFEGRHFESTTQADEVSEALEKEQRLKETVFPITCGTHTMEHNLWNTTYGTQPLEHNL